MKTKAILTTLLILTFGLSQAQDNPTSAIIFETYEWDFGDIDEADGPVSHTFRFANISDVPIQIESVATSCGCTYAEYSTQPIQGGEEGYVTIVFNPARYDGRVMREVEVLFRDRRNYASLVVWANVNPIPMSVENLYPFPLAGSVQTNSRRCTFGYIAQGESVTKTVRIANLSDKTVNLSAITTDSRYGMTVECPKTIGPQEIGLGIKITYNIPIGKDYFGMARDTVWLVADGVKSDQPIIVTALRVEKFSQDANAPKPVMRLEPTYVDFGEKAPGKIYKKTIVIGNNGNTDLIFRNIEPMEGTAISIGSGQVIKPGKEMKVNVAVTNSRNPRTTTMGSINLTTNDPVRPFYELRLQVDTK